MSLPVLIFSLFHRFVLFSHERINRTLLSLFFFFLFFSFYFFLNTHLTLAFILLGRRDLLHFFFILIHWMPKPQLTFSSVQSLSSVQFFVTLWTAACQASLSITNSQTLHKIMPIELVMPSNHLILCNPFSSHCQSFPASVQFNSVAQSCLTFCNPMNRSKPGLPVHHQLPEFIQTHVHWVRVFLKRVGSSNQVAKVWSFQLQHKSF